MDEQRVSVLTIESEESGKRKILTVVGVFVNPEAARAWYPRKLSWQEILDSPCRVWEAKCGDQLYVVTERKVRGEAEKEEA